MAGRLHEHDRARFEVEAQVHAQGCLHFLSRDLLSLGATVAELARADHQGTRSAGNRRRLL